MFSAAVFGTFSLCMIYAAVSDLLSMTIANRVSIILVATFAFLASLAGMEWQMVVLHLAAGMFVLTITFGLFALGAMGGGDAKLLAATSVWMGFGLPLAQYVVWGAMLGGVLTLMILIFRKSPFAAAAGNNVMLRHLADSSVGIPYGIALGAAGLLAFPSSPLGAWALQAW